GHDGVQLGYACPAGDEPRAPAAIGKLRSRRQRQDVHVRTACVHPLDRCQLARGKARVALVAIGAAWQMALRIEGARKRIPDDAVFEAVDGVASLEVLAIALVDDVVEQLELAIGQLRRAGYAALV